MVAQLLRLLRVVRLISAIPELRLIVNTLIRSIQYGKRDRVDERNLLRLRGRWLPPVSRTRSDALGNARSALLTLFRVVTLEDWTDVMYTAMEMHPLAWVYFVSFVVLGTFVVVNLFIAVVLNNLDEAKQEQLKTLMPPVAPEDLLRDCAKPDKPSSGSRTISSRWKTARSECAELSGRDRITRTVKPECSRQSKPLGSKEKGFYWSCRSQSLKN